MLILGGDSFLELPSWRRWEELLETTRVAVMTRPGSRIRDGGSELHPPQVAAIESGAVEFVENPPVDVSATEIRRRLAVGEPIPDDWVPARVLAFARKYSLYS